MEMKKCEWNECEAAASRKCYIGKYKFMNVCFWHYILIKILSRFSYYFENDRARFTFEKLDEDE